MIPRIPAVLALAAAATSGRPPSALAFQSPRHYRPPPSVSIGRRHVASPAIDAAAASPVALTTTALHMSSIPDDDGDHSSPSLPQLLRNFNQRLPPPPEDKVALGGDVVALFVYSYLDHGLTGLVADAQSELDVAQLVSPSPSNAADSAAALPVWFDPAHLQPYGTTWLASHPSLHPPYAPAVAAAGLAFVSLSAAWIACGWCGGAFAEENTRGCSPKRAMVVTLRTWAGTAILVAALAWASDAAWGELDGINALSAPARGGLTRADADFIFDSLTVLAFWRFLYNWLLGYYRR